jgi:hypothetical protein
VAVTIYDDSGGVPLITYQVARLGTQTISGTTPAIYSWPFGARTLTKGGTYWAVFSLTTAGFATVNFYGNTSYLSMNDRVRAAKMAGGTWDITDLLNVASELWCHLSGTYDNEGNALMEPDQPVGVPGSGGALTRTAITASFDGLEVVLEPTQSVYVHRNTVFVTGATAGALYHLQGTVSADTTGDTITPDIWLKLTATLEIDCGADITTGTRKVTKSEDGISYPLAGVVTFSNLSEWLPFPTGTTVLTWDDNGLTTASGGQADWVLEYRSRKV